MTMPPLYLERPPGDVLPLPRFGGLPRSVHVIDEDSVLAINAALATGRPLLVRGEPGTGKSQLARAAAVGLARALLSHAVDARTETRDLLWSVDAVARLAEAQVMGAMRSADEAEVKRRIEVARFVRPGPLWWAFDWSSALDQAVKAGVSEPLRPKDWSPAHGAVVLIDEIDKADASVPNGLLEALGHGRFDVEGRREAVAINAERPPLVVITTNEERALPDAFLRRCLVLHLGLPSERDKLVGLLVARGKAHFENCAAGVLQRAAELLADDREKLLREDVAAPGLAEYIDLVRAVTNQRPSEKEQRALLEKISKFALRKHPAGVR